jgi:hypothetical protein
VSNQIQAMSSVMKVDKNSGTPIDGGLPVDAGALTDGGAGAPIQVAVAWWPANLAVDATSVYWIEAMAPNSGVFKAPIAGGPVVQLATSDGVEPGGGLALDEDNVYYGNRAGVIFKVSKNGGATQTLMTGIGDPADLALDGTNLYVRATDTVLSVPLTGGFVRALATGLTGASSLALDATSVYFATTNDIMKAAK